VPLAGAVGWYEFNLKPGMSGVPMRVLVADFTPAPFQVNNTLTGSCFSQATLWKSRRGQHSMRAGLRWRLVTRNRAPVPAGPRDHHTLANGFEFASIDPRAIALGTGLMS